MNLRYLGKRNCLITVTGIFNHMDDKSGTSNKKHFLGLFMFFGPIAGFYILFVTVDFFIDMFPEYFIFQVFITVGIIVTGIVSMVFSLVQHNYILKKFFNKPKHLVEYSFDFKNPHAKKCYFLMSYFLTLYVIFFFLTIPLNESIETVPLIGNALKIFGENLLTDFNQLYAEIFHSNPKGLDLGFDENFAEKISIFSIVLTFGPLYFLILKFFRLHYLNELNSKKLKDEELECKKQFPGTGSFIGFLYIIFALIFVKAWFDPNSILNIGTNWIILTMIFNLIPIGIVWVLTSKIIKKPL